MIKFSDKTLNLEPRWFTGEEWRNGTAERELVQEYRQATQTLHDAEMRKPKAQRVKERRDRQFAKWFSGSLKFEDNKGLSPMQICQRATRQK